MNYITLCPVAQSVISAITITYELEMTADNPSELLCEELSVWRYCQLVTACSSNSD